MKSFFLFFALCLAHYFCFSQNDLTKQNYYGKVQKVVETEFEIMPSEDGTVISTLQLKWNEYYFDVNGYLVGWVDFYNSGSVSTFYKKEYDSTGNLISQVFYLPEDHITGSLLYEYNNKGQELKWYRKDHDGAVIYQWENFYDKKGNRIKSCSINRNGKTDFIYEYRYNKNHQKIGEIWYDSTQTKIKTISIEYDSRGNQTCITTQDGNMNFVNQWIKKYNEKNKVTSAVLKSSEDDPGISYIYEYDSLNNVVSVMHYDSKGEIVKNTSYIYEYDEHNNWIKKTEYYFDVAIKSWGRQILYY